MPDIQEKVDVVADVEAASTSPKDILDGDKAENRKLFTFADASRLKRKADWHLLPLLILAYLIKNIDQSMVTYTKTMNSGTSRNILTSLHMTTDQYGYLSTVFTVSFIVFEIPMNLIIKKVTPRLQFARIMAIWSVIVGLHAACTNAAGIYAARFFLGVAEAGLWSGIIYHVTCWFRPDECGVRLAALIMLGQFSGIIDALLCYGLAFIPAGTIEPWRWAFIIVGLIGLGVAGLIWLFLPDWPDSPPSRRQFLTPEEGAFMAARLPPGSASSHDMNFDWNAIKQELKSPLLYGFGFINLFANTAITGVGFWISTITASFGLTSTTQSQLLNIAPSAIFVVAALLTGLWLDYTVRVPKPVSYVVAFVGLIGCFIGLTITTSPAARYALILVAYVFYAMEFATCWPLRAQTLNGSSSSAFIYAASNTINNLPGVYTAQIFQAKYAPSYRVPFIVCIVFFVLALLTSLFVWYNMYEVEKETRRVAALRRKIGKETNTVTSADVAYYKDSSLAQE